MSTRILAIAFAIAAGAATTSAQQHPTRAELRTQVDPSTTIRALRLGRRSSAPPLVMLSGWTISANIWEDVATTLAADREVFLIDSRSQGGSSISLTSNTPEDRARDLKHVLESLHIVHPIVIAWSQGVQDLAAYVSAYGDTAFTSSVMVDATPSAGVATLRETPEFARQILGNMAIYQAHPREFLAGMMDAIIGNPNAASLRARLVAQAAKTPVSVAVAMQISDLLGVDRRGARFSRPLLIVVAAAGPLVDDMKQYSDRVGARFESIKDAKHALFVDQPSSFVALIRQFVPTAP